ncbi:unnamed protein product, partial [Chrysoparadoxa australica]
MVEMKLMIEQLSTLMESLTEQQLASEDMQTILSIVWGWMKKAWHQMARDSPSVPQTPARVELLRSCWSLVDTMLLGPPARALKLLHVQVHGSLQENPQGVEEKTPGAS